MVLENWTTSISMLRQVKWLGTAAKITDDCEK
jgi:hypothetical protein